MNILTDILSLIRRGVYTKTAGLDDVLVLGVNEEPDMTGVASPIPYKSVKVIKVRDFKVAAEHCDHANSPAIPAAGTGQVYQKTVVDVTTQKCTVYYRSLKSMSGSNLTLATSADDDYIEITTEGEPNLAANFPVGGSGVGVWKDKVGETLNFRKLIAGSNVTLATTGAGEIEISSTGSGGDVDSIIASGKAFMMMGNLASDAYTLAMTGNNFKMMGKETIANAAGTTVQYSPYLQDWTEQEFSMNAAGSWQVPTDAVFNAAIPIEKNLAVGDTITLTYMITNKRASAGQTYKAVLGWYTCSDTGTSNWPVNLRDVQESAAPNGPVGPSGSERQLECSTVVVTLTTAITLVGYAMFGFNFNGVQQGDELNVVWSISIQQT
tara:strand:- start:2221 stop:3360 length:1140 start_codon:yes stop_codon:yes gene_type:complete